MRSERDLRDALAAVDSSTGQPDVASIIAGGRRIRTRRRVAVGAVVLAVGIVLGIPLGRLVESRVAETPVASATPTPGRGATEILGPTVEMADSVVPPDYTVAQRVLTGPPTTGRPLGRVQPMVAEAYLALASRRYLDAGVRQLWAVRGPTGAPQVVSGYEDPRDGSLHAQFVGVRETDPAGLPFEMSLRIDPVTRTTIIIGAYPAADLASVELVRADGTFSLTSVDNGAILPGASVFWFNSLRGPANPVRDVVLRGADGSVLAQCPIERCSTRSQKVR